ncbi:nucleoside-diphosphate kinase [bacterium]|nr:nucleoside-diphosphate kinase [candidate division CSSED10-310 bacterium]
MSYQRTLVVLKPDTVRRGLAGRIIARLEDAGLDILKMAVHSPASRELISRHYRSTEAWLTGVGNKTIKSYQNVGKSVAELIRDFGSEEPAEIGKVVKERLIRFMTGGPLIAMVIGGNQAIKKVRSLAGYTIPAEAGPGTIRGDFSGDSPDLATAEDRSVENLIHASGNTEEADYEIGLWFGDAG